MTRERRWAWGALAAVLAAAAALRLQHLDAESVWLDEAFSIQIARTTLSNIVVETGHDVHPPLHYFLLYVWESLFGGTAWVARLLSVCCSLGTIAAAYLVAARLRDRTTGLVTAALLACSVFQIEFAQEARMYALLALLSTLSTYAFIRLVDESSPRVFAGYAIVTSLMFYTHAYASFVIAGQAASLAIVALRDRAAATTAATRWVLALIGVFAAFLPWLAIFLWQFSSVQRGFWIPEPTWSGWTSPFIAYAGSPDALWLLGPLAIAGAGSMAFRRGSPTTNRSPLVFVGPWVAAPILLPLALSRISAPIFLAKYTIAASVPFAMLAAEAIVRLPWTAVRAALVAAAIALSVSPLRAYYGTAHKDDWRRAVPVIEQQARPGDLLLFYPYFHQIPFDFYVRRGDLVERAMPIFAPPPPPDGWPRVMDRAVGQHTRVWLIMLQGDPTRAAVVDQFRQRFTTRSHQEIQHIDVYLFER